MGLFPGVERAFSILVNDLRFAGEFPRFSDTIKIDVNIAEKLGGVPLHSVPASKYGILKICETLNYVLKDRPKQYVGVDFADIEDEDLLLDLWNEYEKKYTSYRESLKKNNEPARDRKANQKSESNVVDLPNGKIQDIAERVQSS